MQDDNATAELKPVRIGRLGQRVIAGIDGDYDSETRAAIPTQWANYNAMGYPEDAMVPDEYYGVSHHMQPDGNFGYICGMQLKKGESAPAALTTRTVPAGNYAKFRFSGHISTMGQEIGRVLHDWLPASGYEQADNLIVEYYGPDFNGRTGDGGFEVWLPVRKKS